PLLFGGAAGPARGRNRSGDAVAAHARTSAGCSARGLDVAPRLRDARPGEVACGLLGRRRPPRYVAWVIPAEGQGPVRVIDLGAAGTAEDAGRAGRRALRPGADKGLGEALRTLADLVLQPLLPHIGNSRRWVVSPDAALWLVPWAALPLKDGRYALEEHQIT